MESLYPLKDWQREGLAKIFDEAEKHPSPTNKTRVQIMYGQLGSQLPALEVEKYNERLIKIMNARIPGIQVLDEEEDTSSL
jgi:hypothetical protein